MIYLNLNPYETSHGTPIEYFLSAEEWVADHLSTMAQDAKGTKGNGVFFAWRVPPTVVIGKHQDLGLEVDVPYCKAHGIHICRRRSGGGAVYADEGNIMLSLITHDNEPMRAMAQFAEHVKMVLGSLGIAVEVTGRNDLTIDGAKVSGMAYERLPQAGIVHSTLLYDIDYDALSRALTPSRAKLESKGVTSVASRVTTIKDNCPEIDIEALLDAFKTYGIGGYRTLPAENDIEQRMTALSDPVYLHRIDTTTNPCEHYRHVYLPNVGNVSMGYDTDPVTGDVTRRVVSGDFLGEEVPPNIPEML